MPFRKRDAGQEAARKVIRDAFDELRKAVSPVDSENFGESTLENVQRASLQLEDQLAMRSSIRNMRRLKPLFDGLGYYSKSVEVLCNGTPYLPWLWAPISLILKVSSDYIEAFEQIIKAYSSIGERLTRFRVLAASFCDNAPFQQILAVFYADILRFHTQAYKFVRRSCWNILFMTSWGRFQRRFQSILDSLTRHGELVDKEANAYHIAEARETMRQLDAWRQDTQVRMARDDEEQSAGYLGTITTWLKFDQTDQLAIQDRIAADSVNHPGTCSWILKNSVVAPYLRAQPENPFVWLYGSPGTGKTVLCGQLATFLQAARRSLVICHFCTSAYASSTQYDNILRSLLLQLIRADDDLVAHVYWEYVVGKKLATTSALEQLLLTATSAFLGDCGQNQVVHIILDGVDEVDPDKHRQLINLMTRLSTRPTTRGAIGKVFLSGQTSKLLERLLRKKAAVSLRDENPALTEAIRAYSIQKLKAIANRVAQIGFSEADVTDLASQIAQKADGMFLWARLVLDYLGSNIFHNREEFTASIHTLPRELSAFYERILVNLMMNFDARSIERLARILGWIAFARRPLRKNELRSALSFATGDPRVDDTVPFYVFDMCAPLIEQRSDSTYCFIHVSVKDYLQSPISKVPIAENDVLCEHAIACMACLLSGLSVFHPTFSPDARTLRLLKGIHAFHVYADEYWTDYLLSSFNSENSINGEGKHFAMLLSVARSLSEAVERLPTRSTPQRRNDQPSSGGRLEALRSYPGIYSCAKRVLLERERKATTEDISSQEPEASGIQLREISELKHVLSNYQSSMRALRHLDEYPGVNQEDLILFGAECLTSIFTCRFMNCPRTTTGFETEEARLEHEASHKTTISCLEPGCQYPAFTSTRALQAHQRTCHQQHQRRRQVRRVGTLQQHLAPTQELAFMANTPLDLVADPGFSNPDMADNVVDFDFDAFLKNYDGVGENVELVGRFEPEGSNITASSHNVDNVVDFDFDAFLNNHDEFGENYKVKSHFGPKDSKKGTE